MTMDKGESNSVFATSDPDQLLRLGREVVGEQSATARQEHSLMTLFSHLDVHPRLHAAFVGRIWGQHRAASVMSRLTPAEKYFDDPSSDVAGVLPLTISLFKRLCATADAGFHLADLKLGNMLLDEATWKVYLIDFDANFVSFMDPGLLCVLSDDGGKCLRRQAANSEASVCARARGTMIYLMLLALYHQIQIEAQTSPLTPRLQALMHLVEGRLRNSCVPLERLKALALRPLSELAINLANTSRHYYLRYHRKHKSDAHLMDLSRCVELTLQDAIDQVLYQPGCNLRGSSVIISGVAFHDDGKTCEGARDFHVHAFGDRRYPCAPPATKTAYSTQEERVFSFNRKTARFSGVVTAPVLLAAPGERAR